MRSKLTIAVTVAGLLLIGAASAAGLGRGDAPTRVELVLEADRICAQAKRQVEAAKPESDALDGTDVRTIAAIYRDAVDELQELDPAEQDDAAFGAIVGHFDRGVRTIEQAAAITPATGPVEWQTAFGASVPHLELASSAATEFGLGACA